METDVLTVGGGFGGATTAKRLETLLAASAERVQLVAPHKLVLFAGLLRPSLAPSLDRPR